MSGQANRAPLQASIEPRVDSQINLLDIYAPFPWSISSETVRTHAMLAHTSKTEAVLSSLVFWRNNRPWRFILQIKQKQPIRLSLDLVGFPVLSAFSVRVVYSLQRVPTLATRPTTVATQTFDQQVECGRGGRVAIWELDPIDFSSDFSDITCAIERIDSSLVLPRPRLLRRSQGAIVTSTSTSTEAGVAAPSSFPSSTTRRGSNVTQRRRRQDSEVEFAHGGQPSDVCLITREGRKLFVHESVISSRSPIFNKLCRTQTQIDVSELSDSTAEELCNFMYAGRISSRADLHELFLASKKYAVPELSVECLQLIESSMSVANAANTLIFAEDHGLENLKTKAIMFINQNVSRVKETIGFRILKGFHLGLIAELYNNLISNNV